MTNISDENGFLYFHRWLKRSAFSLSSDTTNVLITIFFDS